MVSKPKLAIQRPQAATKSGRAAQAHPGTAAFAEAFQPQRTLLVGGDGITLEDFLALKPHRYEIIALSSRSTVVAEFIPDGVREAVYQSEAALVAMQLEALNLERS